MILHCLVPVEILFQHLYQADLLQDHQEKPTIFC